MIRDKSKPWIILPVMLVALFVADLSLGTVPIPLSAIIDILTGKEVFPVIWKDIVLDFRMTKAITCVLAGGALSVSGLQMQTFFRNPLAGPDVLGLTSGASLAVSLIFLGVSGFRLFMPAAWTVALAASLGCLAVFLIMVAVARRLRENASLLIVGLMIGAGTSSIVSVLQYVSKAEELQTYIIWTLGSLGALSWPEIAVLLVVVTIGVTIAFITMKGLNAWLLGDNYAQSIGINIGLSRSLIISSACLLTGSVTAFCGPIAFVGLAVPHLTKLLIRTHDHKLLIPAVMMGGGILLLACDILAQLPGRAQVLPINAITALIGAPVVIWVILRNRTIR